MCIFDLDGTLDLTDSKLSVDICRMSKRGISFVTATGRTNSYVRDTCKEHGIMPPRYIIADNGGTIYDNKNGEYIKRTTLKTNTRRGVLEEFIRLGGNPEDIRYTDGEYVYAADAEDVEKYYEKETSVKHEEAEKLIQAIFDEKSDITKVTLAGSRKLMKDIIKFIDENDIQCWTDIGATAFPRKARRNYRLDITDGESSKGEAVEFLSEYTGIREFTCIGNGPNDFSMFKYALDCDMPIIVVRNYEDGKLNGESEEIINAIEEYARSIGRLEKVTIGTFPINRYIKRIEEKSSAKQKRNDFVGNLRAKVTPPKVDSRPKGKPTIERKTQHKEDRE